MRWLLALLLALLPVFALSAQDREYAVGQVWEYENAPQDEGALLKIQAIETIKVRGVDTEVFHISMIGVTYSDIPGNDEVQHLPVARKTLDMSVTRPGKTTRAFPDHRAGLAIWREAVGGVFDISIAQITDALRQRYAELRQNKK